MPYIRSGKDNQCMYARLNDYCYIVVYKKKLEMCFIKLAYNVPCTCIVTYLIKYFFFEITDIFIYQFHIYRLIYNSIYSNVIHFKQKTKH